MVLKPGHQEFLNKIPPRKTDQGNQEPDPIQAAIKEADHLLAHSIVQQAKTTIVNEFAARAEKSEAQKITAEAERLEAQRRKTVAEQGLNSEGGIPKEVLEHPSIIAAIKELIPLVGEARAKAIVYGGLQQGWQPQQTGSASPSPDPFAEIGRTMFEPIAKALGERMAAQLTGDGRGNQALGGGTQPFSPEQFFDQKKREFDAMEGFINGLTQKRNTLNTVREAPTVTPQERNALGFEIKSIDDYLKIKRDELDTSIALFRLNEESRERWARFNDEKDKSTKRNDQIDEIVGLAKENLPTAIDAAQSFIASRVGKNQGQVKNEGGPRRATVAVSDEVIIPCPTCKKDNVVKKTATEWTCACGEVWGMTPQ